MIGKICPRCQNIIKQQPTEHRKTLISKRLTLSNDIIVNRVDTHFLSLSKYQTDKQFEPYTPESIESHSPVPESEIDTTNSNLSEINDTIPSDLDAAAAVVDIALNAKSSLNNTANNNNYEVKHVRSLSSHSGGVSPRQLKSRLENLRYHSDAVIGDGGQCSSENTSDGVDANCASNSVADTVARPVAIAIPISINTTGNAIASNNANCPIDDKNRMQNGCCLNRCCVIL